jgi:hypothetical protein
MTFGMLLRGTLVYQYNRLTHPHLLTAYNTGLITHDEASRAATFCITDIEVSIIIEKNNIESHLQRTIV